MRVFFLSALMLAAALVAAQPLTTTYHIPFTQAEVDTIPGTESGGLGAGKTGWFYVGDDYLSYHITAFDSCVVTTVIDYSDTGYVPATGSSAKSVGFITIPTATTGFWPGTLLTPFASFTAADSLAALANTANPKAASGKVLRSAKVDLIPGARWVRWRMTALDADTVHAAAANDRILRMHITRTPKR